MVKHINRSPLLYCFNINTQRRDIVRFANNERSIHIRQSIMKSFSYVFEQ